MPTIRSYMTDDHRHCDDLFADAEQAIGEKNIEAAGVAFGQFQAAMLAHFASEENTLFPRFEAVTGMRMGPTEMMRVEHGQMRELLEEAAAALASGSADDYFGVAETMLIMMQQHNMKEENILYPMCDQHLNDERQSLLEQLEKELCTE